tara:strand:- start:1765 stop:3162 length:1398 start_codon:yes stop_codon:yes gene_type:complete
MSQTFNNDFKISIIGNGTESGTWGSITNGNLEQFVKVIGGFKQINFSSANNYTLPFTSDEEDTSDQNFRNLCIELTGSSSGPFTLTVPAIDKQYIFKNSLDHTVTIKTSGQTGGIELPVDKTTSIYIDGTNVVNAIDNLNSLSLNVALPTASGGTGASALLTNSIPVMNTAGTSFISISAGATGNVLTSTGSSWISQALGSAAVSNVIRTNVGGYATNNAQPTVANGGTQKIQSYLASIDATYSGFDGVGAFFASREETGITGTRNDSTSVNQLNIHVFKSGETLNTITPLAVRNSAGTADAMVTTNFVPFVDGASEIGTSSVRFGQIYSTSATISTSDQRMKNNIADSDLGLTFINALQPRKFKMNIGSKTLGEVTDNINYLPTYSSNSGTRYHYGLVAQEVEKTLSDQSVSSFAGWCLSNKDDANSDQLLRYEEFIAPMMKAIQELSAKVTVLEQKIQALESK